MGTVISNLKAKFGVDTADFKKGLKDGEKALSDFKGAAGSQINEFAEMFGVNMSAVNDALGTAGRSLSFVGNSFKGAAAGGNFFKIAINGVKLSLLSSGIGALVLALGSVIAYFSKSGRGASQFAKILAQVKSVINNVIDRLAVFGKGVYEIATGKFKQGWETMTGAFKGIGQEIVNDWVASGNLADRLDALDDKEIELIRTLEERKAKAAELRLQAKEETDAQQKKLDLLNKAEALYKSVYGDQIAIERERLDIMKEQLAISASDPTDEQRREVAEQEAKISALYRQQAEELKALNREKRSASEAVKAELDLEVQKLQTLQRADDLANISNIKLPDFKQFNNALAVPRKAIEDFSVNISSAVNEAFESMAVGVGEFLGVLATGNAGAADFNAVIANVFGDLAINVGKVIIAAAIAKGALDKALMSFGHAGAALAAGIALVGIGTAVKASMGRAVGASGGGSAASLASSSAGSGYGSAEQKEYKITLQGKLIAEGKDLAYVLNQENIRRKVST